MSLIIFVVYRNFSLPKSKSQKVNKPINKSQTNHSKQFTQKRCGMQRCNCKKSRIPEDIEIPMFLECTLTNSQSGIIGNCSTFSLRPLQRSEIGLNALYQISFSSQRRMSHFLLRLLLAVFFSRK